MLKFKTSVIIKSSTSVCPAKIRVGYWKKYHVSEKILGHRRTNGMSWKLRGQMMDIMDHLMSVDWHRPCFRNVCMIQQLSTYGTGKPAFVFWFISVLVSLFWRMESGKSDGFPWEISSPGKNQKFPCEPSNILFRKFSEMSVGDERHCLSANIHPRLHLCCQHWNLLLWSQRKTELERLPSVLKWSTCDNFEIWDDT